MKVLVINYSKLKALTALACLYIIFSIPLVTESMATSYTWNGTTSSAWGTSTNWTPNGVPGSGDNVTIVTTSHQPLYDGVAGVTNLTMTSGTLDLNTYQLNIIGTATFNGGVINNGRVNATGGTSTFAGTKFGAVVWVNSASIGISNSVFNDSLLAMKTGSSNNNFDGLNKFNGYVKIENSGTGYIRTAVNGADTFNLKAVFNNTSTGGIYVGNSFGSNNSVFADILMNNTSSTGAMSFGYAHPAYINGNVELNNTSSGGISFAGKNYLASGKTITIGSTGFTAGTLTLAGIKQAGTQKHVFSMPSGTTLSLGTGNVFNGVFEASAPRISFTGSTFNDSLHLVRTGSGADNANGLNKFNGYAKIENTGSGYFVTATAGPDTFNLKAVFNNTSTGAIYVGNSFGAINSVFNGELELNNTGSTGIMTFGYYHPAYLNGNVVLNNTSSGGITFAGKNYFASGKTITIGSTGFTTGTLTLGGIKQSGNVAVSLNITTCSFSLGDCVFGGNLTVNALNIYNTGNNKFAGKVIFTKTSNTANIWSGGNKFSDSLIITNTGTSYVLMTNGVGADTLLGHVNLNNTSSGTIYAGYNYNNLYYGNISVSHNVSFGANGGTAIMKGSNNQTFTRLDAGSTPTTFYKLTIDKTNSSNTFSLNNPIGVGLLLTLTKGNIVSSSTNLINLADNATVSGVSNNSYVDGPFKKTGNDAFTFPVGKNGYYRKIGISAPLSSADAFTAEYFLSNSNTLHSHGSRDGSIADLSRNECWNLAHTTGTSNVSVTLSFDSVTSCQADSLNHLKVSVWDGSLWKDKGNGGTTGNVYIGTVVSSSALSTFNIYTLGTTTSFSCRPGATCVDAAVLGTGDICRSDYTMINSEMWLKFTADSANVRFVFDDIHNYTIDTILILIACGGDTVSTFYYEPGSSVRVEAYNLDINADYLVKINATATGTPATSDFCYNSFLFSRYWVGSGNWNNSANWSTTSGGSGGAGVPHSLDVVKYDNHGNSNCTVNAAADVAGVYISGYTGTIAQGGNTYKVGSYNYKMNSGIFSGGTAKMSVNGNFVLNGGTYTCPSDTLQLGAGASDTAFFNHTAGTFNHNNGTVFFNVGCSSCDYAIDVIPQTMFNNLVFNNSITGGATIIPATDTVEVNNIFNVTGGTLNGGQTRSNNELLMTNGFKGGSTKFFHKGDEVKVATWKGRQTGLTGKLSIQ